MKPFVRTIFTLILSLSLAGLPVVAQSQTLLQGMSQDMEHGQAQSADISEKAARQRSDSGQSDIYQSEGTQDSMPPMDMPCHSKKSTANSTPVTVAMTTKSSSDDDCCCEDCQCFGDMGCQAGHHVGASANLIHSSLFISTPLSSQLIFEPAVQYLNCDSDSEIIPPIA